MLFQSAPPVKGAASRDLDVLNKIAVSIRAPREGGGVSPPLVFVSRTPFQSAPPVKGAASQSLID